MDPALVVPVGAIVPFGGDVTAEGVEAWLNQQGWLPCDGRSLVKKGPYLDLFLAIESYFGGGGGSSGTFNLPDLRGAFMRGTNNGLAPPRDPNAATRTAANPGGNTGDAVGSRQTSATGSPANAFTTDTQGAHSHSVPHLPKNNNAYALVGSHYAIFSTSSGTTGAAGAHTHSVTGGGDAESRPVNVYVNFIIKFDPAP
jgi:microcystin-dependent protein